MTRPAIPIATKRAVLLEAGYRCAVPTCRQETTEFAHIVPFAETADHSVNNLIALCPTCHTRFDKGAIPRSAVLSYKANLALLSGRFHTLEQRLIDAFVKDPSITYVQLASDMGFEFLGLIEDGLIDYRPHPSNAVHSVNGMPAGPFVYVLLPKGQAVVDAIRAGTVVN